MPLGSNPLENHAVDDSYQADKVIPKAAMQISLMLTM